MSVKSNYNFVPAPEENQVYKPHWSDQISHDIPFSDGESGEIEISIKAATPIFIRNGHTPDEETEEFSHVMRDGEPHYFIPATSLKGMIRNVMEIMSKSRMRLINDHRYSFRDLSPNSLYKDNYTSDDVQCGWLVQNKTGDWMIENCGKPIYITHGEIDALSTEQFGFQTQFENTFDKAKQRSLNPKFKSAINKYRELKRKTRHFFNPITYNGISGKLIFTGQPGLRDHRREQGKNGEFIFPNEVISTVEVLATKQKEFRFIYLDHDENNISKEWKHWRGLLNKGQKIPVFFSKGGSEHLHHFGLAFMYKLPFKHSVKETVPYTSYSFDKMDLSETIFGSVDYPKGALKGRVFFSNAFAQPETANRSATQYREILASPKASYYPFYLKQSNPVKRYKTYMDDNATLRGFKRYPRQRSFNGGQYTDSQLGNGKVFSKFFPLEAGVIFNGKIRFHNLRSVEIGALLSALTFHGSVKSFHSLGAAKPFGCGSIKIDTKLNNEHLLKTQDEYLLEFENLMVGTDWLNSSALIEFATITQKNHESLEYPEKPKTFVEYKNERPKLHLLQYSEIVKDKGVSNFPSTKERLENLSKGLILEVKSLADIKKQLPELGYGRVPDTLHQNLKNYIIQACKEHKDSKNKLTKKSFDQSYEWKNTISMWLGESEARVFYDELQINLKSNP